MDREMIKFVSREPKKMFKLMKGIMLFFTVLFILAGIIFDRGMLLLAMLMVVLYWIYCAESVRDYEYRMANESLTIDLIKGKQRRKTVQEIEFGGLEVIAPNWHEAVAKYRKDGGTEKIKKYDYTSYNDDIPYYTMIVRVNRHEKIKLLLDLDREWLLEIKRKYPEKVFIGENCIAK